MTEHRYIGHDLPRPDVAEKATGQALYIHDLVRPRMLYGKIKFSAFAHARIKHIDTSRAERLPGVHAVITGYNTPEIRIGFLRDNLALKRGKVRQFRDEVAAVAATDPDIAAEAVSLIRVEYEPLPGVFTVEAAAAEGAPLVHEVAPDGSASSSNWLSMQYGHQSGDLEAGMRASRHVVEGDFSTPLMQQSCMGTAGCITELDLNGNATIWAKTQIPFLAQRDFNKALAAMGLKGANARVIVPALGGAFGSGLDTHAYEYISLLLAHRTGRPVKMLYTREEEFAHLSPRQSAQVHIVQGCDAEGHLTFRKIEVLQDNGAYTSWGATYPTVMLLPATSLYKVSNIDFKARLIYTNNTYCQAMRGYGNPEVNWALESSMDQLAEQAGIDPVELRLRNCNEPNQRTPMGLEVSSCGLRECIERTADALKWNEKRSKNRNLRRGVGLASLMHVGGSGRIYRSDGSGIILRLDDFGNCYIHSGGVEMGQGLHSALTLTVAETLGLKPDQIFINQTDTATCPWDVGTHASRGAFTACNAAVMAANKLKEQLFGLATELYPQEVRRSIKKLVRKNPALSPVEFDLETHARAENFQLVMGVLSLKDAPDEPWYKLELGKLLRAIHFRGLQGQLLTAEAFYEPPSTLPDFNTGLGNMSATYTFGTQGVEVEVDTDTGDIKILKMVSFMDVGKPLNQQTLLGQTYGGLVQGIGYALYEQVLTDQGRVLNPNFTDYKIPTIQEVDFELEVGFVETEDSFGPFGAKGVGEPAMVPTAPAIANAVYDAIGVRLHHLPMTPERVVAAIAAQNGGSE